jgi:NADH-quinone oxidoreductase subunit J
LTTALFYLTSAGVILAALGVVRSRSAVYSVLAAIQVLVYAGAILVLFLFIVMLTGPAADEEAPARPRAEPVMAALVASGFLALAVLAIRSVADRAPGTAEGTALSIGRLLFTRYALPFELTSLLLLAAVVSVVVLAKKGA